MTYLRLPYDDAATTSEMAADCTEVGRELRIPVDPFQDTVDRHALTPSFGRIEVSDELADLAAGLQLHFD